MRKIRFGVVGTNFVTDWVIAGARQDPRFELAAVCSRTRERAAEFAARHGIARTFVSLEEMAASDAIDAVYIATPNCMHAAQAVCCMERGKHVLCEKPMASNAREVRAMIEASRRNGVALMEAVKTTLTPNFMALREALPKAGTIRRYFSAFCQYSSRYDKFKEGIVLNAFRPELSNGAMMDIGIYTIYPMVVLFGRPRRISASGILLSSGVDAQGTVDFDYGEMNATVLYSCGSRGRLRPPDWSVLRNRRICPVRRSGTSITTKWPSSWTSSNRAAGSRPSIVTKIRWPPSGSSTRYAGSWGWSIRPT